MLGSVAGESQPGARPSAPESRVKQFTSSPYSKSLFARGALGGIPKNFTTSDGRSGSRPPNLSFWTTTPPSRPFPSGGMGSRSVGLGPRNRSAQRSLRPFAPLGHVA